MSAGVNGGEYRFGEFVFDSAENALRRGDRVLSLAPKPLELLRVFVTNPGKLLSKAELMNSVWPDSFVEESNLAVTIRQLRKTLEDDAHKPVYIETVARQGYRFIGEVKPVLGQVQNLPDRNERSVRGLIPIAAVAGLWIASISLGSLYVRSDAKIAPILTAAFAAQRLSTSGKVESAVISPDGERAVYTVRGRAGESVWLREIASENNVEIIPASNEDYYNLELSPDGNTLYFTRGPRTIEDPADVFSVSIFGGIPRKIVSDTRGWISVSPDGALLSFVRCPGRENENCSLWVANAADGKNERMITSRPRPLRIGDHEITPDGGSVVFAVGQSENVGTDFGLMSLDLETGVERQITHERFFNIQSLEVLPGGEGLLLTASRGATRNYRVWKVELPGGPAHALTKDSISYSSISLDDSGSRLIATQVGHDFRLVRASLNDLGRKETVAEQVRLFAFDAEGGIVFQSEATGDTEIWRMNADGSGQRQLTNISGDDGSPLVSSETSDVFFCSNRTGELQVWRMRADGSDQRQVTNDNGGIPLFVEKDWVYYQHGVDRSLWRISVNDLKEEQLLNKAPYRGRFVFSPAGTRAAFIEQRAEKPTIVIVSVPDARELGSYELVDGNGRFELDWAPDETAIAYTLSEMEGESNTLWIQPIDGGPARRTANLGAEEISFLSFAPGPDAIAFIQGSWKHDFVMLSGFR